MEWFFIYGGAENVPGYDCKSSTREHGAVNLQLGVFFIFFGIVVEVMYVIELFVMTKQQHRRLSCYKIMICLGLYDMTSIFINSVLTGYFWIIGANYCNNSTLIYISGSIAVGTYCGACLNCFLLVINRIMELSNKPLMQLVFDGRRTYLMLLLPFMYALFFCFFTRPLLFNSNNSSWFFYTFLAHHTMSNYFNYPYTVNNVLVVILTCLLYVHYTRILFRSSKIGAGLSWAQKSIFIQCASICLINLICAITYAYMGFLPARSLFVHFGHACWQVGNAFPAFVYILLNRTLQKDILTVLRLRKKVLWRIKVTSLQSRTRTIPTFASSRDEK